MAVWKEPQTAAHLVDWRAYQRAEGRASMTAEHWDVCWGNQMAES
jgi:hypothetical protein